MVSERRDRGRLSRKPGRGLESGRNRAQALPASLLTLGARCQSRGTGGNGLCPRRGETGEPGHVLFLAVARYASSPNTWAEPLAAHPWFVEAPRPASGERPLGASQLLPLVCISQDVFRWSSVCNRGAIPLVAFHWRGEDLKFSCFCRAVAAVNAPAETLIW